MYVLNSTWIRSYVHMRALFHIESCEDPTSDCQGLCLKFRHLFHGSCTLKSYTSCWYYRWGLPGFLTCCRGRGGVGWGGVGWGGVGWGVLTKDAQTAADAHDTRIKRPCETPGKPPRRSLHVGMMIQPCLHWKPNASKGLETKVSQKLDERSSVTCHGPDEYRPYHPPLCVVSSCVIMVHQYHCVSTAHGMSELAAHVEPSR